MKKFLPVLWSVSACAALAVPTHAPGRDFNREMWRIEMPEYTATVSSPFLAEDLPPMSQARAMSANRQIERTRFDFFALYAARGHESFQRLYDTSSVWVAVLLDHVKRRGDYDGRLMELEIVLLDGTRIGARETVSHKIGAGNVVQGSRMILLENGTPYREFVTQSWTDRQWQVFVGFERSFKLEEVDRIEWGSDDPVKRGLTQS